MIQQIGKIKLDYTYYPGEDYYCDGAVEQELLEIVKNYPPSQYQKIIEERKSWPILYHLSELRENIVDWLPMDKSMKVLEVGSGCGAITGSLARKAGQVTCIDLSKQRSLINAHRHTDCDNVTIKVGNFKDIEPYLDCDYDYVCLIGVFEYGQSYIGGETPFEDFYKIIKKHVKDGGRLVIAIENKFGLKYWAGCREDHLGTFFSGIEDYPDGGGVRTFSKQGLEKIITSCNDTEYSFYYPYPDYKFMTTLYSNERLPQVGELSDNLRNYDRDRFLLFNEKNVFDTLIKEKMFPFYSNSFMVVIGEKPSLDYCRYSNDRRPETAIKTEIFTEEGKKKVRKTALSFQGAEHIRGIYDSYIKLKKRYEGSKLSINECSLVEGELPYVELEYLQGDTLAFLLDEKQKKQDKEGFWNLVKEYVERISYNEEETVADYDMIFANIMVKDNHWTVMDYEWTKKEQIPTKEIAFRSLYCYFMENDKRKIFDIKDGLNFLKISPKEQEEYVAKEIEFQKQVLGNRRSMSELRNLLGKRIVSPSSWLEAMEENQGKDRVQIYLDKGKGFCEEESFFLPEAYVAEGEILIQLSLDKEVKQIRIDPAMESCIVKIMEFTLNGEPLPLLNKKRVSSNGSMTGETLIFSTSDPQLQVNFDEKKMKAINSLSLKAKIRKADPEMCEEIEKALRRKIRL